MAMTNYPYPASFLEPMPAWPINEAVKAWVDIPTKAEWEKDVKDATSMWKDLIRAALGFLDPKSDVIEKKPEEKASAGLTDREK